MTDLTPTLRRLLKEKHAITTARPEPRLPSSETTDEFLKEAYRINFHITSLLSYLHSIRPAYLALNPSTSTSSTSPSQPNKPLTDPERDSIDSSTTLLLTTLSTSLSNLSTAESLRQETTTNLLRQKHQPSPLRRWAAGSALSSHTAPEEDQARTLHTVHDTILWFLRRGLERAVAAHRTLVERRLERAREKEKSVLYKTDTRAGPSASASASASLAGSVELGRGDVSVDAGEAAAIEAALSPAQLQLFAEENDSLLRQYEDTLGKVQNAEKSLLEISSLQQTLVSHLSTQEEYISQLVTDSTTTSTNVGQGNKELRRATERRSTAQAVFWGTVGLCTGLVVWDLIF
ncbi:putative SNARE protein (Ufe1) [Aspergillus clavatus NRRL 1]|uniref:SNARE protein (Ufe1), putative n=1 Tax=Aspergillus clavatus (strain ATCC 1007 / CBS 513.65 / DSM 816 / NCTC 3887 / NRRL 1 / QM 1276 / 107) TaxID=344612 RepID=A1C626_ASPCL|nr:SNARE protein (Ufe1), putative [Aspergillus clavatus NRRL 1]EAW13847.1 SNARE protein (Ufe1), putative [Aspergillus clavatus NRRL 1]